MRGKKKKKKKGFFSLTWEMEACKSDVKGESGQPELSVSILSVALHLLSSPPTFSPYKAE